VFRRRFILRLARRQLEPLSFFLCTDLFGRSRGLTLTCTLLSPSLATSSLGSIKMGNELSRGLVAKTQSESSTKLEQSQKSGQRADVASAASSSSSSSSSSSVPPPPPVTSHSPSALWPSLTADELARVKQCFEGIDTSRLIDVHAHLVGIGSNGSGCYVNWRVDRPITHPLAYIKKKFFLSACGVSGSEPDCDLLFASILANLQRHAVFPGKPHGGKMRLLAFDQVYREDGTLDKDQTGMYIPNDWVFHICSLHPDVFEPVGSVHPYRKDAVEELERVASKGARIIKWLPNSMGINPMHERCVPFYQAMRRLGLILLTHTGTEHSVDFGFHDNSLGSPWFLRAPLDHGVTVIAAHCASEGAACMCASEMHKLNEESVRKNEEEGMHEDQDDADDVKMDDEEVEMNEMAPSDENPPSANASPKRRKLSTGAQPSSPSASSNPASSSSATSSTPWYSRIFNLRRPSTISTSSSSSSASASQPGSSSGEANKDEKAPTSPTSPRKRRRSEGEGKTGAEGEGSVQQADSKAKTSSSDEKQKISNFELFIKLMDVPKYDGLLYGDISSVTAHRRVGVLETLLNRQDLHHRLINGTDYPVPAVWVVIWTSRLRRLGMISREEERLLNKVFKFNPILFDFLLKRCLRSSKGNKFKECVFMEQDEIFNRVNKEAVKNAAAAAAKQKKQEGTSSSSSSVDAVMSDDADASDEVKSTSSNGH